MAEVRPVFLETASGYPAEVTDTDSIRSGGASFQGTVDMNSNVITGLPTPSGASEPATKGYADSLVANLDLKDSVRLATAAALPAYTASGSGVGKTITIDATGDLNVDGTKVLLNDRVIVKDEATSHVDHGIYACTTEGGVGVAAVLTRATDADQDAEVTSGMYAFVSEGTANGGTSWAVTTADPITVDTTAIAFTQVSGAGVVTGGDGIFVDGLEVNVDLATPSGLEISGAKLRVDVADANELSIDANGLNVEGVPTLFNIGATAVGATVTAANLDTLTDGSNADSLHTHASIGNPQATVGTGGVTIGDPLYFSANDTVLPADNATPSTARKFVGLADATVAATNPVGIATEGDIVTPTSIGGSPSAGDIVYLDTTSGVTVTRPTASGSAVLVVGKMKNATDVFVGPAQYMGVAA